MKKTLALTLAASVTAGSLTGRGGSGKDSSFAAPDSEAGTATGTEIGTAATADKKQTIEF